MKAPRTKKSSALVGAATVVPLIAVAALVGAVPAKSLKEAPLASERATATESSMLCPGPMAPAGAQSQVGDDQFKATGPSGKVGFRGIAVEPESNLLFGQPSVSDTQLDEKGQPKRPDSPVYNHDGADIDVSKKPGSGDFSLVGTYGVTEPFTISSTSAEKSQPVLDAAQAMITPSGDYRSLALTRCEGVGVDRTFMGISTTPGRESSLVLYNPGDRPARASLTVAGKDGVVSAASRSEVIVAPGASERVNVQALAPGLESLALRVKVDGSALGMHVETAERDGLTPMGVEWIAPQAPANRQVIPGVRVHGGKAPRVSVFNTSGVPASATIRLLKADGSPVGSDVTLNEVKASGVVTKDVPVPDGFYTVVVESDAPVGAVARSTVSGADLPGDTLGSPQDFAAMTPSPSITNSSVLALGNRATGGTLALYSDSDTRVQVIGVRVGGGLTGATSLDVTSGSTKLVAAQDVKAADTDIVGFVVVPDTPGVVRGSWVQMVKADQSGPLISSVTLANNNVTATGMDVRVRP